MEPGTLRGKLLISTPGQFDPNFHRTIVLILEHGPDGALGLVLNRPTDTDVVDILPLWAYAVNPPRVMFIGGPVSQESAIGLGRPASDDDGTGWTFRRGLYGTLELDRDPEEVSPEFQGVRIFVGYSGWSPGQLEEELERDAWLVVDAEPGDPFTADPEDLWRVVLARQPGRVKLFANYPTDPAAN